MQPSRINKLARSQSAPSVKPAGVVRNKGLHRVEFCLNKKRIVGPGTSKEEAIAMLPLMREIAQNADRCENPKYLADPSCYTSTEYKKRVRKSSFVESDFSPSNVDWREGNMDPWGECAHCTNV